MSDDLIPLYEDIEKEVIPYKELVAAFKDAVVYLPFDNPDKSMFWSFFLNNFEEFGIKELHATCYEPDSNLRGIHASYDGKGYPKIEYLKGDGSFNSDECLEILNKSHVIVTKPSSSSMAKNLLDRLIFNGKKFLLLGDTDAITKECVFPLIKRGEAWLGYSFGSKDFHTADGTTKKVDNVCWFTNLYTTRIWYEELELGKKYKESNYKKHSDFDAIIVDKIEDIPFDYDGLIAVPLSFLTYYNKNQVEIVDLSKDRKVIIKFIRYNREPEYKAVDKNGRELKIGDYVEWKSYCKAGGTIVDVFTENGVEIYIEEHLRDYFQFSTFNSTSVEYAGNVSDVHLKQLLDKHRGK